MDAEKDAYLLKREFGRRQIGQSLNWTIFSVDRVSQSRRLAQ